MSFFHDVSLTRCIAIHFSHYLFFIADGYLIKTATITKN